MADEITIIELVRNGTLSASMAATLWGAIEEQRSLLVVAIPRFAGKSTVTRALLALLPAGVPVHQLSGEESQMAELKEAALGGYLVVGEFSQAPVPSYIWGEPVRRVFDTMSAGYSLATALHAPGVPEAIAAVCEGNGVSDEAASRFDLVLYIQRFGDSEDDFWRRIAEVYELDRVVDGKPQGRTLYRWLESSDRFEEVDPPQRISTDRELASSRAAAISELAGQGKTSSDDVARLVADHGKAAG